MNVRHLLASLCAFAVLAVGCGGVDDLTVLDDTEFQDAEDQDAEDQNEADTSAETNETCSPDDLGGDDEIEIVTGHLVIDGELGPLCFGETNDSVIEAFEELSIITPPDQMTDLGLFAGFRWNGDEDDLTLAYVTPTDEEFSQFTLSIEVNEFQNDRDEASLTNAHEFAHVFTQTSNELDTNSDPDDCDTYWNGSGCFFEDSLMWTWISEFWNADLLDSLEPGEASVDAGENRCSLDDSFFGQYAASDPEEDFAEAFSAFVYGLEPATDGQAAKVAWLEDQVGLREFRDRADAAGLTPLNNNFETCG